MATDNAEKSLLSDLEEKSNDISSEITEISVIATPPKCGTCSAPVEENDKGIECELCLNWFHIKCQNISVKHYNVLKDSTLSLHWFCDRCDLGAKKIYGYLTSIVATQDSMKADITALQEDNKSLRRELTDLKESTEAQIQDLMSNDNERIDSLEQKMNDVQTKIESIDPTRGSELAVARNEYQEQELEKLRMITQRTAWETDRQQQYSRKENIRVYGIIETEDEDTSDLIVQLANDIGVKITRNDVSVSHRLGRKQAKPRPIIAKFVRREIKDEIMKKKKNLARKTKEETDRGELNIYVNDDLTNLRMKMKNVLVEDPEVKNVSTKNGKILCTVVDTDQQVVIDSVEDLMKKLGWSFKSVETCGFVVEALETE